VLDLRTFTVYAQELNLGVTNGLGIAAFGQSAEQSIKLGEQVVTESVLLMGPRYARTVSVMACK
jgi:hypothetical protein